MIGSPRLATYGRKRNSGSAALAVLGDGWRPIKRAPVARGPFDSAPDESNILGPAQVERLARYAVDLVGRDTARARRAQL
jgi:hypothetical protein